VYVRGIDLAIANPPPPPDFDLDETSDEAEIQFRAAFSFYRSSRWNYAATAFAEAFDYDEGRDDIRFYLAASLLMAGRDQSAISHLEALLEGGYETRVRPLLAVALYRTGRPIEARAAVETASRDNFDAAGWTARYDLLCLGSRDASRCNAGLARY
jgi:tetratricopeptide (TPR) repeat protein